MKKYIQMGIWLIIISLAQACSPEKNPVQPAGSTLESVASDFWEYTGDKTYIKNVIKSFKQWSDIAKLHKALGKQAHPLWGSSLLLRMNSQQILLIPVGNSMRTGTRAFIVGSYAGHQTPFKYFVLTRKDLAKLDSKVPLISRALWLGFFKAFDKEVFHDGNTSRGFSRTSAKSKTSDTNRTTGCESISIGQICVSGTVCAGEDCSGGEEFEECWEEYATVCFDDPSDPQPDPEPCNDPCDCYGNCGDPYPSNPPTTTADIDPSALRDCAEQVLNNLRTAATNNPLTGGPIANMITDFGTNRNIHISFSEEPDLKGPTNQTDRAQTRDLGSGNYAIVINSDYLDGINNAGKETDLALVTDMVHELMHAYMFEWGHGHNVAPNSSLEFLMNLYASSTTDQHQVMSNMVNFMSSALYTYYSSYGTGYVSQTYCQNLVWGGLQNTSMFMGLANANPTWANEVRLALKAETFPASAGQSSGIGTVPDPKGTQPCK